MTTKSDCIRAAVGGVLIKSRYYAFVSRFCGAARVVGFWLAALSSRLSGGFEIGAIARFLVLEELFRRSALRPRDHCPVRAVVSALQAQLPGATAAAWSGG